MSRRFLPVLFVMAACAKTADAPPEPTAPPAPQVATFTATDFAFSGPDTIAPGMTEIRMVNTGAQEHHLILGRLDDGKTAADVMEALAKDPNAEPAWLSWRGGAGSVLAGDSSAAVSDLAPGAKGPPPGKPMGGNGAISPGQSNYWTVTLTPGTYLLVCFVPDPADGAPHVMKGMIQTIVVS